MHKNHPMQNKKNHFHPLRSFPAHESRCLCCFLFACFCFVSWFLLVSVFYAQNLFVKKKKKIKYTTPVVDRTNMIRCIYTFLVAEIQWRKLVWFLAEYMEEVYIYIYILGTKTVKSFKFQSLFYSELNKVCTNCIWILKWVHLHCNWINLIKAYSEPWQTSKMECLMKKVNSF